MTGVNEIARGVRFRQGACYRHFPLLMNLPTGFLSKNAMGALRIVRNIESCKFLDAKDVIAKKTIDLKTPLITRAQKNPI